MYVEDILIKIRDKLTIYIPRFPGQKPRGVRPFDGALDGKWHTDFILSVASYADANRQLSTKQGDIVLKLINDVKQHVVNYGWATEDQLNSLLDCPAYRHPLYESTNVPKEVRHIGDNLLAFRCKGDRVLMDRIKDVSNFGQTPWMPMEGLQRWPNHARIIKPRFDYLYKIWIVAIYRFNLEAITQIIADYRFKMDPDTSMYLKLARKSLDQPSILDVDEDNEIILANVCDDPILSKWMIDVMDGVRL